MIEINLLPGAKRKRGGGGGSFKLPDVKALTAAVRDPWLIGAVVSTGLTAGLLALVYMPRRAHVAELEPRLAAAQRQATQMRAVLRQKTQFEASRESLLSQIATIRDFDRERYIWPHILDAVAKALPQYTWMDDLTTRATAEGDSSQGAQVAFQVTGKSADIQAVTRFVRNLEESPFIQNANIVSTGTVTEQGRDVFTYTIIAQYQRPDSTLLTMRPLAATLVQGVRSGVGTRR